MDWIFIITTVAKALIIWGVILFFIMINIFLERKGSAFVQDRLGPNRASILGFRLLGFIHNFSDAIKLVTKEDILPPGINRLYFIVAPALVMCSALLAGAVIPMADTIQFAGVTIPMQVLDLNVGFLYVFAISSMAIYGLMLGGWSSQSKYPLMAGVRSAAQMISYEISMGLSVIGLVMVFGTFNLNELVRGQGDLLFGVLPAWGIVVQPLGALLFLTTMFAELNRNPFDLPEGESEIVGFHVEYSSTKFALFFMGEYANVFTASAIFATLFLGGWQVPWLTTDILLAESNPVLSAVSGLLAVAAFAGAIYWFRFYRRKKGHFKDIRDNEPLYFSLASGLVSGLALVVFVLSRMVELPEAASVFLTFALQFGAFLAKAFGVCFFVIIIRWVLPRFRYDQLMNLGWKIILPLSLLNIVLTALVLTIL